MGLGLSGEFQLGKCSQRVRCGASTARTISSMRKGVVASASRTPRRRAAGEGSVACANHGDDGRWRVDGREAGGIFGFAGGEAGGAEFCGCFKLALDVGSVGRADVGFVAGFPRQRRQVFQTGSGGAVAFEQMEKR